MKKIVKILGISLIAIIGLLIAAPFLFKDKIVSIIKEQANTNLNAKVDFGDFDLTLISSFPDFRFKINKVSVINFAPFEGDTLAYINQLSFDLNLMSVISGDKYQINSLIVDEAIINATVLIDGKASYDIAKADTTKPTTPTDTSATKFALKLKEFKIKHTNITYNDFKGGTNAILKDLNYTLQGDFTQDVFVLSNLLEIAETTVKTGGVAYLNKVNTRFKADLDMDMPNMKFIFKENELALNQLALSFDGFVVMPKQDIDMDLKFATKQTEFKSILSLIPSVYSKDFANVQTKGKLTLNGLAKGTMHTSKDGKSDKYPSFEINLAVADAMFKYPTLPKAVNDINIDVHVENKKDFLDATTIDVNKFHVNMAGNPVNIWAHVKTPISDPNVTAEVKGVVNLASVKEFIPLEKGDAMSGIVKVDIAAAGRMSSIDKKQYDQFKLSGNLQIDNMNYKTTALPYEVLLTVMKLNFTNQFVELTAFDALMGKSDIKAQGKIENFMQYVFKNELIKGNFNVQSNLLDVNQLMGTTNTATTVAKTDTAKTSTGTTLVPSNIDFVLNATFNKVLYDNLTLDNMLGNITIRDSKVDMTNLKMNTLGGTMFLNGYYETTNPKKPTVKMTAKVENFDIQKTFMAFNTVQKLAPIGKYATGMFTGTLENFKSDLDGTMMPIINSISGGGLFKTNSVTISNFEAFTKLGDALKIPSLKTQTIKDLLADYEFKDGRVNLRNPVKTKINNIPAEITGSTGFDQTLDYTWKLDIPSEMFGAQAASIVTGLLGQAGSAIGTNIALPKTIKANIGFGGTVTKPTLKTSFNKAGAASVKDAAVSVVKDKVNQQAQKYLADAQAQVDKIKTETQTQVDKLKQEGYAQADALVEQASNPISKLVAKKAAEVAKREVDKKAQRVLDETDTRCNKILEEAKAKSAAATSK